MAHIQTLPPRSRSADDISVGITAATILFIVILAVAAVWDPTIRILHVCEALLYTGVAFLCVRGSKFGYALGVASGLFWLWMAWGLTTFVANGFQVLALSLRVHQVRRPDILIALPAAASMIALVALSITGYARSSRKFARDIGMFVLAFIAVTTFYLAIFTAFTPRYLEMFRPILRML